MKSALLQRLSAWLCLAVAVLAGVTPVQGFVLCLESDGCVNLEFDKAVVACDTCGDHGDGAEPAIDAAQDGECPCVDLPVPGTSRDRRLLPKPVDFQFGAWTAAQCASTSVAPVVLAPPVRAPERAVPRPPPALERIRSVVLLV